jgi:hypothetical protein
MDYRKRSAQVETRAAEIKDRLFDSKSYKQKKKLLKE